MNRLRIGFVAFLLLCCSFEVLAQAEPPTTWLFPPKDLTAISYQYLDLETNITPSFDVVLANGNLEIGVNVIPITRTFSLGGKIAQVFISPTLGSLKGSVNIEDIPGFGDVGIDPIEFIDKSGMMDSQVNFRLGLHNAPALNIIEYSQWERKFQVYGVFGLTVPIGEYDSTRRINLGANRWAFRFAAPMVLPLNQNDKRPANWEVTPNLYVFTNNNDPFVGDTKSQKPLFSIQNHLSKYFTSKFFASLDFGYQYGGQAQIDDLPKGEKVNQFAAAVSGGYTIASIVKLQASLGQLFFNDTNGTMFRFMATLAMPSKADRERIRQASQQGQ
jgi:hypothetical protein